MKKKLLAALTLTVGISMLSSCAKVISFPEAASDPGVPLWKETETDAPLPPSDPATLIGIWHNTAHSNVYRFAADGTLTIWGLTPGYDYEYSNTETGSYTYDGLSLTMTVNGESMTQTCRVADGKVTIGSVTLSSRTDEPAEHPSYPYPDFEELAANAPLLNASLLTGQTFSAPGTRLQATVQMKSTYFSDKEMEKLTAGIAQMGDMVNIDFEGKLDGVAFSGGTATGTDVTVAPDTGYIPGFCEGIAGHAVGETFDVNVTFPENYGNKDLAGKAVVFTMKLNAIYNTALTDEMVAAYEGNSYQTVAEWEHAIFKELITENLWSLIPAFESFHDESDAYLYYYQDMLDFYHYYALYYAGGDFELFLATQLGKTVADLEQDSRNITREYLFAAAVVRALEIEPEEAWLNDFTEGYLSAYLQHGYSEEQARELISSGEGKNMFRAAMLLEFAADYLFAHNTFTE